MQYVEEIAQHGARAQYLQTEQQKAAVSFQQELDAKDEEFTRFWRYAGLPMRPTHLALAPKQLSKGKLLNPKGIGERLAQRQQHEVLSPAEVFDFNDATAAPHYLAQTQSNVNNGMSRKEKLERARARIATSPLVTWQHRTADEVKALLKANHSRQKANSNTMNGALDDPHRECSL